MWWVPSERDTSPAASRAGAASDGAPSWSGDAVLRMWLSGVRGETAGGVAIEVIERPGSAADRRGADDLPGGDARPPADPASLAGGGQARAVQARDDEGAAGVEKARHAFSSGRSAFLPDFLSARTFRHPAPGSGGRVEPPLQPRR